MYHNLPTYLLDDLKKNILKVSSSSENYFKTVDESSAASNKPIFELPDGQKINIFKEIEFAGECLFQPELNNNHSQGLPSLIESSFSTLDKHLKRSLRNSLFVSGGNTQMEGFDKRLSYEINKGRTPLNQQKLIVPTGDRSLTVWQGGSVLASLSSISQMWITVKEYEEFGDRLLLIKAF